MSENTQPKGGFIGRYLAMSNDSTEKTIFMALALCLVCSIVVSTSAVGLRSMQVANKQADMKRNILSVAGLLEEDTDIDTAFAQITPKLVTMKNGEYAEGDVEAYEQRKAAKDPAQSRALSKAQDIASIRKQANVAKVYLVNDDKNELDTIILPVHGYGLWSTLYGFLALEEDAKTVVGLAFYEHAETPGLGGEVDNPKWKKLWAGKLAYNAAGEPVLEVVKGSAPAGEAGQHQVDGLAGATLTSRGVSNLVQFWLGKEGFGPYLAKLQASQKGK